MSSKLFERIGTISRAAPGRVFSRRNVDPAAATPSGASRHRRFYHGVLVSAAAVMALAGLLLWSHVQTVLYSAGPFGPEARLPVSRTLVTETSFPPGPDTCFPLAFKAVATPDADCFAVADLSAGTTVWAPASRVLASCALPQPFYVSSAKRRGLVLFDRGRIAIDTDEGPVLLAELRRSPLPSAPDFDMFQADLFAPAALKRGTPPLLFGERTDDAGRPLRWSGATDAELLVCAPSRYGSAEVIRRLIQGLGVLSTEASYTAQAGKYRDFVKRYAEKYNLASALVLAIMHTESNFNPFAVSSQSAVGLMQVVPDTAGNEVYRYLMGTHGSPSIETLFSPEHNIRYGATYLHLLGQRYFGRVRNPSSRQMCMIAAYNGGPGAVLRLFAADQDEALGKINSLTPSEVYSALTTEMPSAETRRYVELVLARIRDYSTN